MDTALLDRVEDEVTEIKVANKLTPDQPVRFRSKAWTRQGTAD